MTEDPAPTFRISGTAAHPVLSFAAEELARWLTAAGCYVSLEGDAALCFELAVIGEAAPASFGFRPGALGIRLWGADETCVLHAVYTLLEAIGCRFQITGPLPPVRAEWDHLREPVSVIPRAETRGIRQHLNFPMDLSSYSLEEAREYLRNLARLRFNHITFHSYPNQFTSFASGPAGLAGFFFYGQRHPLPCKSRPWSSVRNERIFCIPEIEPFFDDRETRSRLATGWLQALMAEAKRVGLRVCFSFEPRRTLADTAATLAECAVILDTYPDIDVIELMTQETGDWGEVEPAGDTRDRVRVLFGPGSETLPTVEALLRGRQPDLGRLLAEFGHNLQAAGQLQARLADAGRAVAVGLYCTVDRYLPACLDLYRQSSAGVRLSLLPGHGSEQTARNVAQLGLTTSELAGILFYSWLEFDGLMFLQQNAIPGIRLLLEQGVGHVCFNHWRTAENRAAARYAASAALGGSLNEDDFYCRDAADLNLPDPEPYRRAMHLLAAADARSTRELPNVGFCYVGVWGDAGVELFRQWDERNLAEVGSLFEAAHRQTKAALRAKAEGSGRCDLEFLGNRARCSRVYLQGIRKAKPVVTLVQGRSLASLTAVERAAVLQGCNAALRVFSRYLRLHSEHMPDRGCEGTLVSAFYTPMSVLRRIRHEYGGGACDPYPVCYESADAPPPPGAPEPRTGAVYNP